MSAADTAHAEVPERFRGLVPGRRYRVTMDDCCIQGYFEATFLGLHWINDGAEPFLEGIRFDTALIGPEWGQFVIEEVSPVGGDGGN